MNQAELFYIGECFSGGGPRRSNRRPRGRSEMREGSGKRAHSSKPSGKTATTRHRLISAATDVAALIGMIG